MFALNGFKNLFTAALPYLYSPDSTPKPEKQTELKSPLSEETPLLIPDLIHKPLHFNFLSPKSMKESKKMPVAKESMDTDADELFFYTLGCAGNGGENQKKVARLMNTIAEKGKKPEFIVLLGDNFYNAGIDDETSPAFKSHFYDIYHSDEMNAIKGIPFFVIAGNHDLNIHRKLGNFYGLRTIPPDFKKINAQIKHTYLKPPFDSKHALWNMPSRYYSRDYDKITLFFIDSSTYPNDYLNYYFSETDENNQAFWLEKTWRESKARVKIIFQHHPSYTIGKRYRYSDASLYLDSKNLRLLSEMGITGNYNDILKTIIFDKQKLYFDATFSAHDHCHYAYTDKNFFQIVAGGGGGELDERYNYIDGVKVPYFIEDYGFVSVKINPSSFIEKIVADVYSVKGLHLQMDNTHPIPRFDPLFQDSPLRILRNTLILACRRFIEKNQTNYYDVPSFFKPSAYRISDGLKKTDHLINFLNSYEEYPLETIVSHLNETVCYWYDASPSSLRYYVNEALLEKYTLTHDEFTQSPEKILMIKESKEEISMEKPRILCMSF